jgi:hypothetical protein
MDGDARINADNAAEFGQRRAAFQRYDDLIATIR